MLKLIRFSDQDFSDLLDHIPDVSNTSKNLFDDIINSNDCTYVDFIYSTLINHNRLYKEPEFPIRIPRMFIESKTLMVDVMELMISGYLNTDCPLSDKYSSFFYDDMNSVIDDVLGVVIGPSNDPVVDYEHKIRLEYLMEVIEIVSVIDDYIEGILKGALIGFGEISSIMVTIAHDSEYLYLILSDEFRHEFSTIY
ncbi:hypothetical protein AGENTSMITH_207 [Bacillus phage vB_BspM_AgentSmith]|nr:hypothetical protein AGENTSMITH_207 [Bacillus phage vB_BspM_AgentSmith]